MERRNRDQELEPRAGKCAGAEQVGGASGPDGKTDYIKSKERVLSWKATGSDSSYIHMGRTEEKKDICRGA